MTIDEAIQYLNELKAVEQRKLNTYIPDALKLGIEALKRLKEHREEHIDITYRALPGETKD